MLMEMRAIMMLYFANIIRNSQNSGPQNQMPMKIKITTLPGNYYTYFVANQVEKLANYIVSTLRKIKIIFKAHMYTCATKLDLIKRKISSCYNSYSSLVELIGFFFKNHAYICYMNIFVI